MLEYGHLLNIQIWLLYFTAGVAVDYKSHSDANDSDANDSDANDLQFTFPTCHSMNGA